MSEIKAEPRDVYVVSRSPRSGDPFGPHWVVVDERKYSGFGADGESDQAAMKAAYDFADRLREMRAIASTPSVVGPYSVAPFPHWEGGKR